MKRFGVTNYGDPSLNYSWVENLKGMEGAIVISKGASTKLEDALLENRDKIIYHATCTGLGGTMIEPNVPTIVEKFDHIKRLIKYGFHANQIVMRIDPVMPIGYVDIINKLCGINYIEKLRNILDSSKSLRIERIRYSYLKLTKSIKSNFENLHYEFVGKNTNEYVDLKSINPDFHYEACCENLADYSERFGCISDIDTHILGVSKKIKLEYPEKFKNECRCPLNRVEMILSNKGFDCSFGCIYCYLKDNERKKPIA
jgi:DNA repair photolyase